MFGPALLGLLADFTSVQTALCANAALLAAVMGFFAVSVRKPPLLRLSARALPN